MNESSLTNIENENASTTDIPVANDPSGNHPNKEKRFFKRRKKIYEITKENDMKFHGFLSYRSFKILAWLFIIFSQIKVIADIKTSLKINPINSAGTLELFDSLSELAMPLLLISVLSIILNGRDSYKKMLIMYGSITIGFFLGALFVYERYILGMLSVFSGNRKAAGEMARSVLSFNENGTSVGFITFNIFIDIFLCTLIMFFLNYHPKEHFQGKNIIFFRAMVIIPILYGAGNVVLKYMAATQKIKLPLIVMPFLTTKSPLIMVLFIAMAIYIKKREQLFIKHGKTLEEYHEFLKTNTNSFQFSKFMILMILLLQFLAVIIFIFVSALFIKHNGNMSMEKIKTTTQILKRIGISGSMDILGLIPFLFVYSYTKLHKHPIIDIIIPIIGVVIIILIYIDSTYMILHDVAEKMMTSTMMT